MYNCPVKSLIDNLTLYACRWRLLKLLLLCFECIYGINAKIKFKNLIMIIVIILITKAITQIRSQRHKYVCGYLYACHNRKCPQCGKIHQFIEIYLSPQ